MATNLAHYADNYYCRRLQNKENWRNEHTNVTILGIKYPCFNDPSPERLRKFPTINNNNNNKTRFKQGNIRMRNNKTVID